MAPKSWFGVDSFTPPYTRQPALHVCLLQESAFGEVRSRHFLMTFYRLAAKRGLDVPRYNLLKESAYQIEKQLARLRDPLQMHLPVRPMEIPPPPSPSVLTRAQDQIRNLLKMRTKLTISDSPKTQ